MRTAKHCWKKQKETLEGGKTSMFMDGRINIVKIATH